MLSGLNPFTVNDCQLTLSVDFITAACIISEKLLGNLKPNTVIFGGLCTIALQCKLKLGHKSI